MINHADVMEFMAVGIAGLLALAFVGWQYNAIRIAVENGKRSTK